MPQSHCKPSRLCIPCMKAGCNRWFRNRSGHTQHVNAKHPIFLTPPAPTQLPPHPPSPGLGPMDFGNTGPMDDEDPPQVRAEFFGTGDQLYRNYHPFLSILKIYLHYTYIARPCDPEGVFLPPGTPPPPLTEKSPDDWTPYRSCVEFELADYLFTKNQTPANSIDQLLNIWSASLIQAGGKHTLFSDHRDLYRTIDNTPLSDIKWQSFSAKYTGTIPDEGALPWMEDSHEVWFRDPHDMDFQPYREFATENDEHQWKDFISGDWSWAQADKISEDPDTHGSTFVPVILGSDKTTVSVATGQNDYYPLYASIGNIQNNMRRAHCNAVVVIGFLAMPKSKWSLNLKPAMTKPEVTHFGDGHYHRVIYGLGPYIADYEEQVLLACIFRNWCAKCLSRHGNLDDVNALIEECDSGTLHSEYGIVGELVPFMNNFPRIDIHKLLAPDILHQLIKGAYKDHLVDWVKKYLLQTHGKRQANIILDDIDRRIAAVPPFPGLRRFPQGRHFKQWTGDDLKALMKVYLPAIEGYVPVDVVRSFRALLEFCYLVRRNVINEKSLSEIEDALTRFHTYREIFKMTGVVTTFSLPRQHSMSKHIKAVKEPWRRSGRYKALGQMLLTNQHLDKLAMSRVDFRFRGMLAGTCVSAVLASLEPSADGRPATTISPAQSDVEEPHTTHSDQQEPSIPKSAKGKKRAQSVPALANELDIPHLADLVSQFLIGQLYPDKDPTEVPESIMDCPHFNGRIRVFNSAVSMFFAPSNLSGIGGMKHEYIRVSPKWRTGHACKDCVLVITDSNAHGMRGMDIAQVLTFFSFRLRDVRYPCTVVCWFNRVGNAPDDNTGMWMVEPSSVDGRTHFAVIHVDSIFRSTHLIPVYGTDMLPPAIKSHHILDIFTLFYVNKYADHHAFEIAA
ncbi:uncharacterized protein F5147DRAFT_745903 [Suillus discolor]|uniref:C2H2-type domain-containing protein n=1 Tax=Suillus discolor TaxID=1912936 RepID=A0A9P7F6N5_9AGAM|nr:uncharacterized protein F5147DRAFT_745903 [Suillus discolor]KAG2107667.1 hypothetical protein F5147DRAFT_745903 [Suillus discolor]